MLRVTSLVILTSMSAVSSVRIGYEDQGENWIDQKPIQNLVSWYSKHAYTVTVRVIHGRESDSMYRYSARFMALIHKQSDIAAVFIKHHLIDAQGRRKSYELPRRDGRRVDGNEFSSSSRSTQYQASETHLSESEAFQPTSDPERANSSKTMFASRAKDLVTILLVPDDLTFQAFLDSSDLLQRNAVKLMLIIIVPESRDSLCHKIPYKKGWKEPVRDMLERVWSKYKVLNVFLSAPTSPCIKDYLFSWNPFITGPNKAAGALKMLKITKGNHNVELALSKFVNTLGNMNGYPLKVTVFERKPTVIATFHKIGEIFSNRRNERLDIAKITGMDAMVLKTMLSSMNCTAELYPPSDAAEYGYYMPNGTFTGMIGDIVYRRVDFAANGVFLKDYQTGTAAEFTIPIGCESICVVVPRARKIPQWVQIFQCFSPLVWNLLIFNVLMYGLLRYVMRTLLRERHPRRNLLEILIETALIFISSPQKLPNLCSERILLGFYLLFNVIVVGTFQGTLYESFAHPAYYNDINTLAELDMSGIVIGTSSPNLGDIFGKDDDSPTLTHLRERVKISIDSERSSTERTAWKKDTAAVERKNDLQLSIHTKFLNEHGDRVLHVVEECPRTYQLTYMVPSGAFFLCRMNVLLRRMMESGLITHWYNSSVDFLIMKNYYALAKKHKFTEKTLPFSLKNLKISFIILTCGLMFSTIVFLWEKVNFRYKIERKGTKPEERRSTFLVRRRNDTV